MERVFRRSFTIFIVATAGTLYQEPEAIFASHLQDGTLVYGGSVMFSWDVVVRNNSIILSNLDIWVSNRDSGARVGLESSLHRNCQLQSLSGNISDAKALCIYWIE